MWALWKKNGKETPKRPLFKNAQRFACYWRNKTPTRCLELKVLLKRRNWSLKKLNIYYHWTDWNFIVKLWIDCWTQHCPTIKQLDSRTISQIYFLVHISIFSTPACLGVYCVCLCIYKEILSVVLWFVFLHSLPAVF